MSKYYIFVYVGLGIIQNRHTIENEEAENGFLNTPSFLYFECFQASASN